MRSIQNLVKFMNPTFTEDAKQSPANESRDGLQRSVGGALHDTFRNSQSELIRPGVCIQVDRWPPRWSGAAMNCGDENPD
jgi:hypothetical protein